MFSRQSKILVVLAVVMLVGCKARLNDERKLNLGSGEIESVILNSVGYEQAVTVTASSTEAPIGAHVYLIENEAEVERSITLGAASDKIIAQQPAATEIKFVATIPANKEAVVRFENKGAKPTEISISIKN